nr:MAG TPA: hypothetical protein [Caudoviricetes sp.]
MYLYIRACILYFISLNITYSSCLIAAIASCFVICSPL